LGYISSKTESGTKTWLSAGPPNSASPFVSRIPMMTNWRPPMSIGRPMGSRCGKSVSAMLGVTTVTVRVVGDLGLGEEASLRPTK
jgi:hypothetical protein